MSTNNVKNSKAQASESIIGAGLSKVATDILINNLSAKNVQGGAGIDPTTLPTTSTTLALVILDESPSMDDDQVQVVSEFKDNLEAIRGSHQADEILMSIWAFNERSRLVHSYLTLDLVEGLTDYRPCGQATALFDTILDGLTAIVDYEGRLRALGQVVKLNITVVSDGNDNESRSTAADVKAVVLEILKKRENATFNFIALGNDVDETVLAESIGFPDPKRFDKTPAGRRRAFGTWSSSVIKTSQTKIGTSGGLFTP